MNYLNKNKMKKTTILFISSMFLSACFTIGIAQNHVIIDNESNKAAFIEWTKDNVSEIKTLEPGSGFDDLRSLQKSIGDARIVFIGESRHDAHEHFKFKHRLVEFLVEEMGFTLFAMEESLPYGDRINKYVLGGEDDPEVLLNNMGNWFVWDTKEVLELIKWMRKYNADPKHDKKVEFCGIDVTDPIPAIENVLVYLKKVDSELADLLKNKLEKVQLLNTKMRSEYEITGKYISLSDEEVDSVGEFISRFCDDFKNNRSKYISKSSKSEYNWMLQQVKSVIVAHDIYRMRRPGAEGTALSREDGMTNNIRWLLGRDNRRIVLWAHNMHIAKSSILISGYRQNEPEEVELFGSHIGKELGDDLFSIGFSYYQANYKNLKPSEEDMLGAVFNRIGSEMFFLNLRAIPKRGPVFNWFNQEHRMNVGAFGDGAVISFNPVKAYDAIIFTKSITETELSPVSFKRRSYWE